MNQLNSNQVLGINDYLQSTNGHYRLVMQDDGNCVLYRGYPETPDAIWDTGTYHLPSDKRPKKAIMQPDGNFVLYNEAMEPAWATNTNGNPGAYLTLQDDRNLVVYGPGNKALWSTNTWISGAVHAHLDNNVAHSKRMVTDAVLYRNGELVINSFTSNGSSSEGLRGLILVVIADSNDRAIWVSQIFKCSTRCSRYDPSCGSEGRETFSDKFPDVIGEYAVRLDIYQADNANYVDLRNKIIQGIKDAGDIYKAVKDVLPQLK